MIERILGTSIIVSDLARAITFYTQILQFEHDETVEEQDSLWAAAAGLPDAQTRSASLRLGIGGIELIEVTTPKGRLFPPDSRSNDLWFQHIAIVVQDMDAAYARLREHRVQHVSSMPQTLPDYLPNAAGIRAFYFRDPDGHNLELIQFPEGKGNPIWREPMFSANTMFLGVDHTAIGIAATPRSLSFYQDTLGLIVTGESENYGPEQEHLNMVFGAHLHITGLTAVKGGLGLEFLEYLAPPGGRLMPADTQCNDLWYWETRMLTRDLESLVSKLPPEHEPPPITAWGTGKQAVIRDPDGHALRVMEVG